MNLQIGSLKRGSLTSALIADALRIAIIQGTLKSKQALRQDEIATEYGVSKIPVREALFQLEAEGLVTFYPNRGAIVSTLSPAEANEIYVMRIALESVALKQAIPQLKAVDFSRADGILNAIDHETDPFKWGQLNWEFHTTLYDPANMPRLMHTVRTLHVNVARYFGIYQAIEYRDISQQEHRDLLSACQRGEIKPACACLTQHLQAAAQSLIIFLEQQSE